MVSRSQRRWGLLAVGLGILLWHSMAIRADRDSAVVQPLSEDPPTGAVLVDLHDHASAQDRAEVVRRLSSAIRAGGGEKPALGLGELISRPAQIFRLRPPAGQARAVVEALKRDPRVEAVELERTWKLPEGAEGIGATAGLGDGTSLSSPFASRPGRFVPNDPYYKHQWHLDQIQMPRAWTLSRGRGAVVAVIDTGVLFRDHERFRRAPDLATTRFVPGWDFVDGDATPDDEHGHGTHVAGTIAQSTHNGIGVAGVAPEAAIMPIRVLDRRGAGRWGAVAAGIRWAADHGADVINLSLGGGMPSTVIRRAIEHAHEKGVVVVAAAGNTGRGQLQYPAAHAHVVSVGAVRFDGELAFYSSHGKGLDLVAPGGDLRVDQNGDGLPDGVLQNTMVRRDPARHDYVAWQGTSMAAPHVAGAAALLRASGVRDPRTLERLLASTAAGPSDRVRYGAGVIQVADALQMARQGVAALRGFGALLLGLVVLLGLRRAGRLDVAVAPTLAIAFLVAGGAGILPWHAIPSVGPLLSDLSAGVAFLSSGPPARWLAPVVLSAAFPVALILLLLGARPARPVVVGVALGFGGLLLAEALLPTAPRGFVPDAVAGAWLLGHGAIAVGLGRLAALRA